jgi:hypothetical protein
MMNDDFYDAMGFAFRYIPCSIPGMNFDHGEPGKDYTEWKKIHITPKWIDVIIEWVNSENRSLWEETK